MKKSVLAILAILFSFQIFAQNRPKIGLVLSGGGAKGLAHVGVLKVLEENNIPIDYIVGTSMGGIVGGFYAAGYNADEIEKIVSAPDFQEWAFGKLGTNHKFIHPKDEENASFVSFHIQIDSNLSTTFQSNIVNDAPLNFALGQYLYIPIKEANYNFDSLAIPFRCMAADIFTQSEVILKKGSLSDALRTTMAVPLVFRAIQIDDRYMYDGGLYNNFPADVMRSEFNPDIIIGVNVSAKVYDDYPYEEDDEMIKSPLKFLFLDNSDLAPLKAGDIYIEPKLDDISAGSFEKVDSAIQRGVDATMLQLDSIKKSITVRLEEKRPSKLEHFTAFDDKVFGEIEITGLNTVQSEHIRKILASRKGSKKKEMSISELREGYYRLISDNYFSDAYPKIQYDSLGFYRFSLDVNSNQKAALELGGNLSSRSISAGFVGVKFSLLDKLFYNFSLSGFTGRFYTSGRVLGKITFPTYNPFYIEAEATFNNWEYSNINELIFKKNDVALVDRVDRFIGLEAGRNIGERNTISLRAGYGNNEDLYFNTDDFSVLDKVDETSLDIWLGELKYLRTTLNRKKFASSGEKIAVTGKVFTGIEKLSIGTTSALTDREFDRSWTQLKVEYERYYGQKIKIGIMSELSLSTQPKFANYKSTLINAPALYPLIDSRTLFLEDFRAFSYLAGGTRLVFPITKDALDFRLEGYGFLPYRKILEGANQQAVMGDRFSDFEFAGTASLVYHTPFGPISASLNYYSDDNYKFGVLFNVGYLLFNNRVLGD